MKQTLLVRFWYRFIQHKVHFYLHPFYNNRFTLNGANNTSSSIVFFAWFELCIGQLIFWGVISFIWFKCCMQWNMLKLTKHNFIFIYGVEIVVYNRTIMPVWGSLYKMERIHKKHQVAFKAEINTDCKIYDIATSCATPINTYT